MEKLCALYKVSIVILDLNNKKKISIHTGYDLLNVKIVKCGTIIGIYDREYKINLEEEELSNYSLLYYDLETVGEKQSIYAYSLLSSYVNTTMFDVVEDNIVKSFISDLNKHVKECSKNVIAYAWNGSGFDSHIMLKRLAVNGYKPYNIILTDSNKLLSFTISLSTLATASCAHSCAHSGHTYRLPSS